MPPRYADSAGWNRPTSWNFAVTISLSNGFMMYSLAPARSARAMCATSFSVVQNTTLGRSPPGMRRRWPRNSKPSITGMFQSSRIASGSPRLQTSSAFSPSSASIIWKSSPSRIRRATFRTTLESSTTRHVFIAALCSTGRCGCDFRLCRQHGGLEFEDAIDVEHDHELAVEAMDAAGELGHAGIEIDRVFLAAVVSKLEHFADLVDQKTVGFAAQVDAHRHRRLAVVVLRQPKASAHVDHGDDAAAQIEHPGDLARRQRHPGQPLRHEHVLHPRDRQPEQLAADHRGDEFGNRAFAGLGLVAHAELLILFHAVRLNLFMPPCSVRRSVPSALRSGRGGRTWRRNRGTRPAGRARSPPATPSRTAR